MYVLAGPLLCAHPQEWNPIIRETPAPPTSMEVPISTANTDSMVSLLTDEWIRKMWVYREEHMHESASALFWKWNSVLGELQTLEIPAPSRIMSLRQAWDTQRDLSQKRTEKGHTHTFVSFAATWVESEVVEWHKYRWLCTTCDSFTCMPSLVDSFCSFGRLPLCLILSSWRDSRSEWRGYLQG